MQQYSSTPHVPEVNLETVAGQLRPYMRYTPSAESSTTPTATTNVVRLAEPSAPIVKPETTMVAAPHPSSSSSNVVVDDGGAAWVARRTEYLQSNGIPELMDSLMDELLVEMPPNPREWLRTKLLALHASTSTSSRGETSLPRETAARGTISSSSSGGGGASSSSSGAATYISGSGQSMTVVAQNIAPRPPEVTQRTAAASHNFRRM